MGQGRRESTREEKRQAKWFFMRKMKKERKDRNGESESIDRGRKESHRETEMGTVIAEEKHSWAEKIIGGTGALQSF